MQKMNTLMLTSSLLVCALTQVGCDFGDSPQAPAGFAPIASPESSWSIPWPDEFQVAPEDTQAVDGTRQVRVQARFLRGPAGSLRRLGVVTEAPYRILDADDVEKASLELALAGDPSAGVVVAPAVLVSPGRKAVVSVHREESIITDLRYLPATREADGLLQPVLSTLRSGQALTLTVTPRTDGGVRYTQIEAISAYIRDPGVWRGIVDLGGKAQDITWQEPLAVVARTDVPDRQQIDLKAGEVLAVPLVYHLHRAPAATVRLLARDIERDEETPHERPVAAEAIVLLLRAQVVDVRPGR